MTISLRRARDELRLPPEPKLSEELQVSRGRLRTLLKRMEAEGLIWRHVGKGTFVGPKQSISSSGGAVAESVSLEQVMQCRLALEPQLAAQAAIHATQADLKELDNCMERMTAEERLSEWKTMDDALHLTIAGASHNALLLLMFKTMKAEIAFHYESRIIEVFDRNRVNDPRKQIEAEHLAVVDAIKRHDPEEAESAMRQHILSVRASLFGQRQRSGFGFGF